ncbi:MAG TPA: FAD-dependent oxidoreductase, partial [Chloroflexota bacterium]
MTSEHYTAPFTETRTTDVLVVGGGPGGIGAAVAAARNGADVTLVEQYGVLGGMGSVGLVGPFMTSYSADGSTQLIRGVFEELVQRMVALGGAIHPGLVEGGTSHSSFITHGHAHVTPFDPEALKYAAAELCLEAGVHLLLHTFLIDACHADGRVTGAVVANKSGLLRLDAQVVVDASGDGDIAHRAGAEMVRGRASDGLMQPMTMFFRVGNVDSAKVRQWVRDHPEEQYLFSSLVERARAAGDFTIAREKVGIYETHRPGEWRVNTSRIQQLDGTSVDDLTKGEVEGRRQVFQLMRFFHQYLPGFEQASLIDTATQVGVRETRRIVGEYTLTAEDLIESREFPDTIALCAYPIDIHSPDGKGGVMGAQPKGNWYEIPYRILVPVKLDGLLAAGRCVSATHEAAGAIRVQPPGYAMG